MTTIVDTIVTGLDAYWDGGIITKPTILSKFISRDTHRYATVKAIDIDSVIVEQHSDRVQEVTGIDGAGAYFARDRMEVKIVIQTPGLDTGDGLSYEDRLKGLYDAVKDALSDLSGSGYLYRIFRTRDTTPKGQTNKWKMDILVEALTPSTQINMVSGGGPTHTLDSVTHSDVAAMTEATGDLLYRTAGGAWDRLAIGSTSQILTVIAGLPSWQTGGGGGEVNTASSQGSGTSIYYQKSVYDLQFNAIKSENNLLAVALDGVSHDVELTVNEANIDHANITNTHNLTTDVDHASITNTHNLTTDVDHTTIQSVGTNTHAQIDTHLALTNEHIDWEGASPGTIHTDAYIEGGDGTDGTAIHDNVNSEISAITEKTVLVGGDMLVIEDSEASNAKKMVQITNLPGGADADAIHDNVANEITAITPKATPVSADEFVMEDSAASFVKKAVTFGNLEGTISHINIADIGTDSHATIDTFIDNYVAGGAGTDTTAIHDNVADEITAITAKTAIVTADEFVLEDSEAAFVKKAVTFGNLAGSIGIAELSSTIGDGVEMSADTLQLDIKADSGLQIDTGELSLKTTAVTAHYPVGGAVPYLDGAGNNVDMEPGHDATNHRNFYKVTANAADQDGDVVFEIYIPDDYQSLQTTMLSVWNYTDDTTNAGVTITVDDGTTEFNDTRQQNASWTQTTVSSSDVSSLTFTAGNTFIVRVKCDGDASDNIYVGSVEFHYNRD